MSTLRVQLIKDGKALRSFEYTGQPIELGADVQVVVTIGKNKTVVPVSELEFKYSNNINKGKATVIISAKEGSSYYGSKAVNFTISKGTIKWF